MRAVRTTRFTTVTLALILGTSVATVAANQSEDPCQYEAWSGR